MKTIQLTNSNQVALVDDEDYDYLNQWTWRTNASGYACRKTTNKQRKCITFFMHRVIMAIVDPTINIDHINDNKLDNQRSNLRCATRSQNTGNQRKLTKASSKYKGVSVYTKTHKWQAQINCNKQHYYLGLFATEIEAARAYNKKAVELFGAFARLNEL